jgi:Fe-S cluster assembly scaffold protein SufB
MELSKTLPEEQSELYKRYFLPLPLDQISKSLLDAENGGLEEEEGLRSLSKTFSENLQVKADAVIGSTKHFFERQNEFVRILNSNEVTEEQLADKGYKSSEDKLVALIHATSRKYVFINVPDKKKAAINLLFANFMAPLAVQVIVKVGREAELSLFEWYSSKTNGKAKSMMGVLHEVDVGPYAKSEINIVHNEDFNTYVLNFSKCRTAESGRLGMNYVYNGGFNTRAKNELYADGFASRNDVMELIMGSAEQKFDLNTVISNVGQDTVSDLGSRAALMDGSACLLKGFANVETDAKGSRSFVNERGILLDKTASMSSIPGMSIKNANVRATHSSATAPIDAESEFYLMSKGADSTTARKLMISGFFSAGISKMESPVAKSVVASLIHEKINNKKFGTMPKLDISNIWFASSGEADIFEGHYKYRDLK